MALVGLHHNTAVATLHVEEKPDILRQRKYLYQTYQIQLKIKYKEYTTIDRTDDFYKYA